MTLGEFEKKRCEKLVAQFIEHRRPAPHIRAELDLGFRVQAQSIDIFEVRPDWQDKGKYLEFPVAKATYNKSKRNLESLLDYAGLR